MTTSSTTSTRRRDAREALVQATGPQPGSPQSDRAPDQPGPWDGGGRSGEGRRVALERALQILAAVAPDGDADLAQTCRGILDVLHHEALATREPGDRTGVESPKPLLPPRWARRTVSDDGGLVHEVVSEVRPLAEVDSPAGRRQVPTEVSLSVTDLLVDGRWIRTAPTVQLEGACYGLDAIAVLRDVLGDLLEAAEHVPSAGS